MRPLTPQLRVEPIVADFVIFNGLDGTPPPPNQAGLTRQLDPI
jgi:hypothetical protein